MRKIKEPKIEQSKPVLSLILCSRNDGYMGDPVWRLKTALNYAAEMIYNLGRESDVEIIVTDWGSEIPLNEVTGLSALAHKLVSFLVIPRPLAKELQKDSHFSEVHALNAAAKRARGEFIGRIDQDTLVGEKFLKNFFDWYEGNKQIDFKMDSVVLFSNRKSIPYRFANLSPHYEQIKRFINWFGAFLSTWKYNPHTRVFWTSYVGICLFHRNLWEECSGYDERLIYYDWMEVDLLLRLKKKYPIINLGELVDYDFYHLDHYQLHRTWSSVLHPRSTAAKSNDYILDLENLPEQMNMNPNGWGISGYDLILKKSGEVKDKRPVKSATSVTFIFLLINMVFRIICDGLNLGWYNLITSLLNFYWKIRSRVIQSWQIARENSIFNWPRLLVRVWVVKK